MKLRLAVIFASVLLASGFSMAMAAAPKASALGGRVVDSVDQRPLGGVEVDVFMGGAGPQQKAVATTTTRGDGSFAVLGLHGGAYHLELSKRGYALEIVTGVVLGPGERIRISSPFGMRSAVVTTGVGQAMETRI